MESGNFSAKSTASNYRKLKDVLLIGVAWFAIARGSESVYKIQQISFSQCQVQRFLNVKFNVSYSVVIVIFDLNITEIRSISKPNRFHQFPLLVYENGWKVCEGNLSGDDGADLLGEFALVYFVFWF